MYNRLGKVANISGIGDIETIYNQVKKSIIPNIIFLYGAPSTGKTEIAKTISK